MTPACFTIHWFIVTDNEQQDVSAGTSDGVREKIQRFLVEKAWTGMNCADIIKLIPDTWYIPAVQAK